MAFFSFLLNKSAREKRSTTQIRVFEMNDGGRPIDEWLEAKLGKPAVEVTIEEIQALPRRKDLRYGPLKSPLGGRLDAHLEHPEDEETARLLERGDRFLEETQT